MLRRGLVEQQDADAATVRRGDGQQPVSGRSHVRDDAPLFRTGGRGQPGAGWEGEFDRAGQGGGEDVDGAVGIRNMRDRLGGGPVQRHAVQIHAEGPEEIGARRNGHGVRGKGQRAVGERDGEARRGMGGGRILADMVVDEQEAAAASRPDRPAQGFEVILVARLDRGGVHGHGGEPVAIGAQEIMERAQCGADRVDLPILADRRLKIIADHRAVIIAARPLRFFQAAAVRKRVRTAMKHIIAQQVDARSDLRGDGGSNVGGRKQWPAAIHDGDAAAIFRAQKGRVVHVVVGVAAPVVAGLCAQVAAHPAVEPEEIIFLGRQLRGLRRPGFVRIAAMDGHHLSLGIERLIPSGDSVERHVIAEFER